MGSGRPIGWTSYDSVADTYERVAVPCFAPIARDLLDLIRIRPGDRLLDLGTGTGLVAELARESVGPDGLVVGIDPSTTMLGVARSRRHVVAVAGMAPGLPFGPASFDAVVANLVLSHLPDLGAALAELVQVLAPGGRLGASAWAPERGDPDDEGDAAYEILGAVREEYGLTATPAEDPVPWEALLRSGSDLSSVLERAGLVGIEIQARPYRQVFTVEEYLSGWGGQGRFLRWHFGEERWREVSAEAARRLESRFGGRIVTVKDVWLATGNAG